MWIIFGKYKILCIFEHQKRFKTIIGYNQQVLSVVCVEKLTIIAVIF